MQNELTAVQLATIAAPIFATVWGASTQTEEERPDKMRQAVTMAKQLFEESKSQNPQHFMDAIREAVRDHI